MNKETPGNFFFDLLKLVYHSRIRKQSPKKTNPGFGGVENPIEYHIYTLYI